MVRILAMADFHGSMEGLEAAKSFIDKHEPDILVIAGDITHFGPPEWAEKFLDSFDIELLAVNGNCDSEGVADVIKDREKNDLIDKMKEIAGLRFVGLGYPPKIDFASLHDERIDVLVSHVPPKGCNDAVPGGEHIGDFFLRDLAQRTGARLVLSGHVHESRGICELENTVCVNPGPAKDGLGAIIDVGEKVDARLIEI